MPAQDYLDRMRNTSAALPPTARIRLMLDELLTMVDTGRIIFTEDRFGANTCALYKTPGALPNQAPAGPQLWGARVQFKTGEYASFVHELTHARCILCYRAQTINYVPGGINNVPEAFTVGPPPGAPPDSVTLTEASANNRRTAWERPHCKTYLDANLENLRAWAEVTDFTSPSPFMTPQEKAAIKQALADMAKQDAHSDEAFARYNRLEEETKIRGVVQKSNKFGQANKLNKEKVDTEKQKKRAYINERINYGLNGLGGLGNSHNEYDTVVNQMLVQMYEWGYRLVIGKPPSMTKLAKMAKDKKVPAAYLYGQLSTLVHEAHRRRMNAESIFPGQAPAIQRPSVVINAPV